MRVIPADASTVILLRPCSDTSAWNIEVLRMNSKHVMIQNRDARMGCGACFQNCPASAIAVQTGVGCANAVMNAMLGRNNGECCCEPADTAADKTSCC